MARHSDRQYCCKCCLTYCFNKPEYKQLIRRPGTGREGQQNYNTMPSSRCSLWTTHNELNGVLGLCCLIINCLGIQFTLLVFCLYNMLCYFYFYGISLCINVYAMHMYVLLVLFSFIFGCFILNYLFTFSFALFYYLLLFQISVL